MAFLVSVRFIRRTFADPDFASGPVVAGEGFEAGAGVSANSKSLMKNERGHVIGGVIIFFMTLSLFQCLSETG
jgi:hypothetical protein